MFIDLTSISFSTGYVFAKHIINTIWYSEASVQRYSVKSVFCRKGKENVKNRTLTNFGTRLRHRSYTWTKKDTSVFSCKFYFFFFQNSYTRENLCELLLGIDKCQQGFGTFKKTSTHIQKRQNQH